MDRTQIEEEIYDHVKCLLDAHLAFIMEHREMDIPSVLASLSLFNACVVDSMTVMTKTSHAEVSGMLSGTTNVALRDIKTVRGIMGDAIRRVSQQ